MEGCRRRGGGGGGGGGGMGGEEGGGGGGCQRTVLQHSLFMVYDSHEGTLYMDHLLFVMDCCSYRGTWALQQDKYVDLDSEANEKAREGEKKGEDVGEAVGLPARNRRECRQPVSSC